MCISDFLKNRRERRENFIKTELSRFSPNTRKDFLDDTSMSNRKKYVFLVHMHKYNKKYTKLLGEEKTSELFKSASYEELKSFNDLKERFGKSMKPSEIKNKLEDRQQQAVRLEKGLKVLKEKIEKVYGDPELIFPVNTQFHNIKAYYRYKDSLKAAKEDINSLEKVNKLTKDLVKFEPVVVKEKSTLSNVLDRVLPCCR